MRDLLPADTALWQHLEASLIGVLASYGYQEIRVPLLERTELFARSIGEVTDIVEKEMYTFRDRNGDSLTLRPEGTAGCVRAGIEQGLLHNQVQRLWYMGPMFRHERPQKGRYRQFHQIGAEAFGLPGPDIDAELILMSARMWLALGLAEDIELEINSLGTAEERAVYRECLVEYLRAHADQLDDDSRRRLDSNPLRVLDSKNPAMRGLIEGAPLLGECLGADSRHHFEGLRELLDRAAVPYRINPHLVRGLDYYCNTVFEWVTGRLGAQGTVCAGGRYDGLVEQLGGRAAPAVGFALGLERLAALLERRGVQPDRQTPHAYLITVGEAAERDALGLAEGLRAALPGLRLLVHCGGGGFKSQFRKADRSGAQLALIVGEEEALTRQVAVKDLRTEAAQQTLDQDQLLGYLEKRLGVSPAAPAEIAHQQSE